MRTPPMLPENQLATRFQKAIHLLDDHVRIVDRAKNLYAQHRVHCSLDGIPPVAAAAPRKHDGRVFRTGRDQLIFSLEIGLCDFALDIRHEVGIGLEAVDDVYLGRVEAAELVACAGAEFDDCARGGGYEAGNSGCGFEFEEVWFYSLAKSAFQ